MRNFAHMKFKVSHICLLFVLLMLTASATSQRSCLTSFAKSSDSTVIHRFDSIFHKVYLDSIAVTITDTARVLQLVRVRRSDGMIQVIKHDTVKQVERDTVTAQTIKQPPDKKSSTLEDILWLLVILVAGVVFGSWFRDRMSHLFS